MKRFFWVIGFLSFFASCDAPEELSPPVASLSSITFGHILVIDKNAQKGPLSREATPGEWSSVLEASVASQVKRYAGETLFHIGIGVDGYVLARPGIPIALSPKSALIFTANVWDNATQDVVNAEPKRFVVVEGISGDTLVGSGLTRSKEEQMVILARNGAAQLEKWLAENPSFFDRSQTSETDA